jgi:nicotinate-nucleotide adenylyltransferase
MKTLSQKAIGILGGSFDPVHLGHCAIAQLAYECLGLSKVYFIPANTPPHKTSTINASPRHRLAMLRIACKGNKLFEIWDGEIRRKGVSYTIDTISFLKKKFPDVSLCYIIGSDNITEMLTWREYEKILPMITICIARRPGYSTDLPPEFAGASVRFFSSPQWGISSTSIRSFIKTGLSCRYLVPPGVESYIRQTKLYR